MDVLSNDCGIKVDGANIGCLAYADDNVLVADSAVKLQRSIDRCMRFYREVGLSINVAKCATFSITAKGHIFLVNTGATPAIDGVPLP